MTLKLPVSKLVAALLPLGALASNPDELPPFDGKAMNDCSAKLESVGMKSVSSMLRRAEFVGVYESLAPTSSDHIAVFDLKLVHAMKGSAPTTLKREGFNVRDHWSDQDLIERQSWMVEEDNTLWGSSGPAYIDGQCRWLRNIQAGSSYLVFGGVSGRAEMQRIVDFDDPLVRYVRENVD